MLPRDAVRRAPKVPRFTLYSHTRNLLLLILQRYSLWLLIWLVNNIAVTLLNKMAFATVNFKYPYFLSAIHMACNAVGSQLLFWLARRDNMFNSSNNSSTQKSGGWIHEMLGGMHRQDLSRDGQILILGFSVVFSLNIAIGNVSLSHVSVNFNQVLRSMVPVVTIAIGMLTGKVFSTHIKLAVLPVIAGVAMACFGDMGYTSVGLFYTVVAVVLGAVKVVASGEMLTGPMKLHPVDLLGYMAPLALVQCLAIAYMTGEVHEVLGRWNTDLSPSVDPYPMFVIWLSGAMSFLMNISSLMANKLTSPLSMCIAGNVKQVLLIGAGTILFNTPISPLNGAGILVVLAGSTRYSYVSYQERNQISSTSKNNGDELEKDLEMSTSTNSESDSDFDFDNNDYEEDSELLQIVPSTDSLPPRIRVV